MLTVNIRDLKNNLSAKLQFVRAGQELVILDRTIPIAKIVPLDPVEEPEGELLELAAAGILRLPKETLPTNFWDEAPFGTSTEPLIEAISQDRDEAEDRILG